jgi:hypothetical protein
MSLMYMFLTMKLRFEEDNLAFFGSATVWATFSKIQNLGTFSPIFWSPFVRDSYLVQCADLPLKLKRETCLTI